MTFLPSVLVVDVDGTVADMGKGQPGRRSPFDWDRVGEDTPIQPVIDLVAALRGSVDDVIWMSGRDRSCRTATREWLAQHAGFIRQVDLLYMRPEGDNRSDDVVKKELYEQHIADRFTVRWVIDDRNKVVAMWRSLGLTVLQVADGDF